MYGRVMQLTSPNINHDTIEAGIFPPRWTAHDGGSVAGEWGRLHIALNLSSLRLHSRQPLPTHWLLPLNNPEMVRLSSNLPGELLWLSPRQPRDLAGWLVGDFQGAWWAGSLAMLKLKDAVEVCFVPPDAPGAGSLALLGQIVALRWSGWTPDRIQAALQLQRPAPAATPARTHAHLTAA